MQSKVLDILSNRGYEFEVKEIVKGGVITEGLVLKATDRVGITIYPKYIHGTDEEVAEKIIEVFESHKNEIPNFNLKGISNWEWVKDRLRINVRPVVETSDHITRAFLDLQLIVRLMVDDNSSVVVSHQLCGNWGKTEDEVFDQAFANNSDYVACSIFGALMGGMSGVEIDDIEIDSPMYVVTNKSTLYGAAVMTNKDLLQIMANKFNSDLFIIPSSIHEVIVIGAGAITKDAVDEMVGQVNATEVSEDEVLSNHVYLFNKETGEITY